MFVHSNGNIDHCWWLNCMLMGLAIKAVIYTLCIIKKGFRSNPLARLLNETLYKNPNSAQSLKKLSLN